MIKKKKWHIHIMKYYLAIKWKEILIDSTIWTNLENIMLSEISQTQKATYFFHIYILFFFHLFLLVGG